MSFDPLCFIESKGSKSVVAREDALVLGIGVSDASTNEFVA